MAKELLRWDITADFKKDVFAMWNICRRNCALWNFHCNFFKNLEKNGYSNGNFVSVNLSDLKVLPDARIMIPLAKAKLISGYDPESDVLSFTYKNEQIHRCLTKAGDILELYTYITAKEISYENNGYYDDIDIGVVVDWDGVIYPEEGSVAETRNEIDIMLMRDLIPIFISCKNGEVHKEALYELNTVARKFGGEYSKKILLTTYISNIAESRKYIMQRARDMKIDIIEGIDKMDYKEFFDTLRKRAK